MCAKNTSASGQETPNCRRFLSSTRTIIYTWLPFPIHLSQMEAWLFLFLLQELLIGHNPVMWCLVWTLIRVNRLWKIVKHRQEETNNQLLIIQKSQCQLHDILKDVYPSNFFSLKLEAIVMALISKSFYV